jgi:hypothetical protein
LRAGLKADDTVAKSKEVKTGSSATMQKYGRNFCGGYQ